MTLSLDYFQTVFSFNGSYTDGDLGSNDDYGSVLFNQYESELTINVYMGMPIYIYWADGVSTSGFDFNVSFVSAVIGCTDPTALNYNSAATQDDGSCFFPVYGCIDPAAFNYDPFATDDDGSCIYCTDNVVQVVCDGGSWQTEVSWNILLTELQLILWFNYWFGVTMMHFVYQLVVILSTVGSFGDGWNRNYFNRLLVISLALSLLQVVLLDSFSCYSASAICIVNGCTDPAADNYDQQPTQMTDHVLMHVLEHLLHLTRWRLLGELRNRSQFSDGAGNVVWSVSGLAPESTAVIQFV